MVVGDFGILQTFRKTAKALLYPQHLLMGIRRNVVFPVGGVGRVLTTQLLEFIDQRCRGCRARPGRFIQGAKYMPEIVIIEVVLAQAVSRRVRMSIG